MAPGRREGLILVAAGIAAAAAGFLVGPLILGSREDSGTLRTTGMVDQTGKRRALIEWHGKVLVCNFWATWCAPCREEIPLLIAAKEKYGPAGVEIVGIAVDNAVKVSEFSRMIGITYPVLLAESAGLDLMHEFGNKSGALPYTVFLDRRGRPVHRKLGALKQGELDTILGSLARN